MSDSRIWRWSMVMTAGSVASGEISASEVLSGALDRIAQRRRLNAWTTVASARAQLRAQQLDDAYAKGGAIGPLHGVPIGLKDNIRTVGMPTTYGSLVVQQSTSDSDAGIVARLVAAGAVIVGKLNLYEFAFGGPHPNMGETVNPWDHNLSCGGSSNGSAVAVADGQVAAAFGTDTGGSIRIPAAMCGIVGHKPTRGMLPNRGIMPVCRSLDVVGGMTRSLDDAILLHRAAMDVRPEHLASRQTNTVGVPELQAGLECNDSTLHALAEARSRLEDSGLSIRTIRLPDLLGCRKAMWTLAASEMALRHRKWIVSRRETYSEKVRHNIELGAKVGPDQIAEARSIQMRACTELDEAAHGLDAILLPSLTIDPYRVDQPVVRVGEVVEDSLQAVMRTTTLANLTGRPSLVVPIGKSQGGPPPTVQLLGHHGADLELMLIGRRLERTDVEFPNE